MSSWNASIIAPTSLDIPIPYEPICTAYVIPLTIAAGPVTSGVIGYSFGEAEVIGGGLTQIPISILLWDTWANPVVDCTSVYFTVTPETGAEIVAHAKTNNVKPGGDEETDHWPGVAWTKIIYNNEQIVWPDMNIIGETTGSFCSDSSITGGTTLYDECQDDPSLEWLTDQQIIISSEENDVPYQNVCV